MPKRLLTSRYRIMGTHNLERQSLSIITQSLH